jgi:hypothetical protein
VSRYRVSTPGGTSVELSGSELDSVTSSASVTLARKILRLRKEQFPNDPEKWVFVQKPMSRKIQLLP